MPKPTPRSATAAAQEYRELVAKAEELFKQARTENPDWPLRSSANRRGDKSK